MLRLLFALSIFIKSATSVSAFTLSYPPTCNSASCSSHGQCISVAFDPTRKILIPLNVSSSALLNTFSSLTFRHLDVSDLQSTCICDTGWTGDDLYRVWNDCHIPTQVQTALYALCLAFGGVSSVRLGWILFRLFLSYDASFLNSVPLFNAKLLVFLSGFIFVFLLFIGLLCLAFLSAFSAAFISFLLLNSIATVGIVLITWICSLLFLVALPADAKRGSALDLLPSQTRLQKLFLQTAAANAGFAAATLIAPLMYAHQSDDMWIYRPYACMGMIGMGCTGLFIFFVALSMIRNLQRLRKSLYLQDAPSPRARSQSSPATVGPTSVAATSAVSTVALRNFYSDMQKRFLLTILSMCGTALPACAAMGLTVFDVYYAQRLSLVFSIVYVCGFSFVFGASLIFAKAFRPAVMQSVRIRAQSEENTVGLVDAASKAEANVVEERRHPLAAGTGSVAASVAGAATATTATFAMAAATPSAGTALSTHITQRWTEKDGQASPMSVGVKLMVRSDPSDR